MIVHVVQRSICTCVLEKREERVVWESSRREACVGETQRSTRDVPKFDKFVLGVEKDGCFRFDFDLVLYWLIWISNT